MIFEIKISPKQDYAKCQSFVAMDMECGSEMRRHLSLIALQLIGLYGYYDEKWLKESGITPFTFSSISARGKNKISSNHSGGDDNPEIELNVRTESSNYHISIRPVHFEKAKVKLANMMRSSILEMLHDEQRFVKLAKVFQSEAIFATPNSDVEPPSESHEYFKIKNVFCIHLKTCVYGASKMRERIHLFTHRGDGSSLIMHAMNLAGVYAGIQNGEWLTKSARAPFSMNRHQTGVGRSHHNIDDGSIRGWLTDDNKCHSFFIKRVDAGVISRGIRKMICDVMKKSADSESFTASMINGILRV